MEKIVFTTNGEAFASQMKVDDDLFVTAQTCVEAICSDVDGTVDFGIDCYISDRPCLDWFMLAEGEEPDWIISSDYSNEIDACRNDLEGRMKIWCESK